MGIKKTVLLLATLLSSTAQAIPVEDCREIVLSGSAERYGFANEKALIHYFSNSVETLVQDEKIPTPWAYSTIPLLDARLVGYEKALRIATSSDDSQTSRNRLKRILRGQTQAYAYFFPNDQRGLDIFVNHPLRSELSDHFNRLTTSVICGFYTHPLSGCSEKLSKIIESMAPVHSITAIDLIKEVLYSQSSFYEKSLSDLAEQLMDRIDSRKIPAHAHLFTDLLEKFVKNGFPQEMALKLTWKVMGLLASRGSNFYVLEGNNLITKSSHRAYVALSVIAAALPVLDSLTFSTFRPYSLPDGIVASCDTGKLYHFWMTAYLAHREKKSDDDASARWAAYISNIGYQMRSNTLGRDPNRAFHTSALSVANQKIRIDLAYAAAGAVYGSSHSNSSKQIDVDASLNNLIYAAESLDPHEIKVADYFAHSPLKAFFRWNKIFHPEAALRQLSNDD